MIQDISPILFSNAFSSEPPSSGDAVFAFSGGRLLARTGTDVVELPTAEEFWNGDACSRFHPIRLFSMGKQGFYLAFAEDESCPLKALPGFGFLDRSEYLVASPPEMRFAIVTALHLLDWYESNRRCGRCGAKMGQDAIERALSCSACGNRVYPRINPAVIVAVRNGDSLLMARYADKGAYKHRALIAGFCEIGETAEQTVAREVMEEAGVRVKNICYYKSQPWGIAGDLLLGFVCDVDGETELSPQDGELASVEWVRREDIFEEDDHVSLTREMIVTFKNGKL